MSMSRRLQWDQMRMDNRSPMDDCEFTPLRSLSKNGHATLSESQSRLSVPRDPSPVEWVPQHDHEHSGDEVGALAMLQVALAEEKRRNIAAEQRVLAHEKELATLRAENKRLTASAALPGGIAVSAPQGPLEQTVRELQEQLRRSQQHAQGLEERLAERDTALERATREAAVQEDRIRQLERTMADELIRRSREHAAADVSYATSVAPTPRFQNTQSFQSLQTFQNAHAAPLVSSVSVAAPPPASVRRGSALRERSLPREQSLPRDQSLSRERSLSREAAAHAAATPSATTHSAITPSATTHSAITPSPSTHSAITPSATIHSAITHSVAKSSRGSLTARAPVPGSRPVSAPRRPAAARPAAARQTGSARRPSAGPRRASGGPAGATAHAGPKRVAVEAEAPQAQRSVARPPPMEPLSAVQHPPPLTHHHAHAAALARAQTAEGRAPSVMSSARSRPRIHQMADGVGSMRTTTTIVTRSAKRRESPVLVPQPRADSVEEMPSGEPFVSEKFSTTTYRPNRLLHLRNEEMRVSLTLEE